MTSRFCPKCGEHLITHDLKTYYCPVPECRYKLDDLDTIDISFKSQGLAKALSNLCNYTFTFDGIKCNSMESFIQSLRTPEKILQKEICSMSGPFSYSIRTMLPDWRKTQIVYWKGQPINRQSDEYTNLIGKAYYELYIHSDIFAYAIEQSKKYKLIHSIGCIDKFLTLLTPQEYIEHLNSLRF